MATKIQKEWCDGKYLPPRKRSYKNLEDYTSDIQRYVPIRIIEAYREDYGKRGY
jgi:hypothetical protein